MLFSYKLKIAIKLSFCSLVFLFACQPAEEDLETSLDTHPYYDLQGLISRQIALLDSLSPEVAISARIGAREEQTKVRKDSAAWAETLQLYADADLNNPVLRGMYQEKDSSLNDSPWQARIYRAHEPEEVDIPYLKVYYEDSPENVRYVEALFREENPLYSTRRLMSLQFSEENGSPRLTGFKTLGRQKMIFRDSVTYVTTGKLVYQ
ncbi:MAG: hypothetical protein ACLFUB_05235 [Cyclobacteriaceae bacterium]